MTSPEEFMDWFKRLVLSAERIATGLNPVVPEVVGTPYLARKVGCTAVWIAQQARDGKIPSSCIVAGTGNGKPWKFHRHELDKWLASR